MATTVTISQEEYDEMQKDIAFLECLRDAGVDNWDGYDFAVEAYQEQHPNED